ncbi:unnamed protein product [Oppiella nova]|uniref:Protein kinase domain-containing protein n=1 Tax=Oppiella nova TaxID=334625 RepID=A0A7R9M579_9ACAR|nr:unnamed protein product [Oppiella nova]CAG2169704.1 unnamed protein product [Oppiella nova]
MDGRIKLCDFGLAKEVPNTDWYRMSKTRLSADVGTIDYMAPESIPNWGSNFWVQYKRYKERNNQSYQNI